MRSPRAPQSSNLEGLPEPEIRHYLMLSIERVMNFGDWLVIFCKTLGCMALHVVVLLAILDLNIYESNVYTQLENPMLECQRTKF